ncbi:sigma-70 family RNA polymerase sigma factor [Streptomyces sp. SID13031]|uniref:RNA polymerase sigma factor n=1 Tax=Streptomyces sp. SID13031 TaxID=2706046 RepID=UPI0013C884FA|nr:sigma-70 family RNA polymerase sigma factor [Streptomyces sp. SID13031]NEA32969.1 sigma-70 family RNA polymerase sigma factor [Streptomyces sp. SID13031]
MVGREDVRVREARFEALVRVVAGPVQRYLVRRADADAVEDVLAETMVVLWRRIDDVPGLGDGTAVDPDEVLPWCYGVARGCLANARRADGRRLRLVERLTRTAVELPAASIDHSELYDALRSLGELDREVVMLWAWEGLAPKGIAEVTGLTPNAVSIRLHRAKKRLAVLLGRKNETAAGQELGKEGSEL